MIKFITQNHLLEMLTETAVKYTLDYEHNQDVSLHAFLGTESFKRLVLRTVEIIKDEHPSTALCLLDTIKETK